jgi:archaetidylinositol phosphate synthase
MFRSSIPPAGAHRRDHRGLLAVVEKRALIWMARRLPERINSDHLSAFGLIAMLLAGAAFAAFHFSQLAAPVVVLCLAANWLGDSLDGTLARVRGHERPRYGFYVDHVIDIAGATFLLTGLACSGLMSPVLAMGLLTSYLAVSAESYLATYAVGVFRMSFLGWGPTELRILLAAGALRVMRSPEVSIGWLGPVRLFDAGAVAGVIGLTIAFGVAAIRNTCALSAAEPLPGRDRTTKAAA